MFFFLKYDLNDSARVSWSLESFFMLLSFEFDGGLPGYDLIEEILLFNAAFVKIDAGGLDTFVTQNIGEKCNIIPQNFLRTDGGRNAGEQRMDQDDSAERKLSADHGSR